MSEGTPDCDSWLLTVGSQSDGRPVVRYGVCLNAGGRSVNGPKFDMLYWPGLGAVWFQHGWV